MLSSLKSYTDSITSEVTREGVSKRIVAVCAVITVSAAVVYKFYTVKKRTRIRREDVEKYVSEIANDVKFDNVEFTAPKPGKLSIADYRFPASPFAEYGNHEIADKPSFIESIRVVTWNVGKGNKKIQAIIDTLVKLDADIVMLQELDHICSRSFRCAVGCEIAAKLGYQLIFGATAWHEDMTNDDPASALYKYNDIPMLGCTGNGILTRFELLHSYPLVLPCVSAYSKERHDHTMRHTVPVVVLKTPSDDEIACYCVNMDEDGDKIARSTKQFQNIYSDIIEKHSGESGNDDDDDDDDKKNGKSDQRSKVPNKRRQILIAGNFQTHMPPKSMLASSEALYWKRHVIGYDSSVSTPDLKNRLIQFKDPFDVNLDYTTRHYKTVFGLDFEQWRAKTDWLIYDVDSFECQKCIISEDNTISDHEYMMADLAIKANR